MRGRIAALWVALAMASSPSLSLAAPMIECRTAAHKCFCCKKQKNAGAENAVRGAKKACCGVDAAPEGTTPVPAAAPPQAGQLATPLARSHADLPPVERPARGWIIEALPRAAGPPTYLRTAHLLI